MNVDSRYEALDWLNLDWHGWTAFRPLSSNEMPGTDTLTTEPGLYRIRHPEYDRLVYIGETGRSTRGRVGALARGTFAAEMPFRDPHTAAPTLWAIREEYGPQFEVSWVTPTAATTAQSRKAIEAALIALHRTATQESPVANFGRIIPGYVQSGYSRAGEEGRGRQLSSDETEQNATPGSPPLEWTAEATVAGETWMGLDWSRSVSLNQAADDAPADAGVYRLWQPGAEKLTYIGESQNLHSRLRSHRRERDQELLTSYATLEHRTSKHELLEVETDLIGFHWLATRAAPADQF